ncbi:uncharacterized protein BDR25DRAFT_232351 [Lindgomyces ingoldianus]|uniref:Uncharacterized protein n=1 Tax=Lindgomyces ingoldianus TaxID=673940 RepID=A0ACB6QN08_9PLEO|nr:uncharacterized protein BDR25DRAFT_232351 [Lindgomyces ingoldianus]KAF2468286.1 hypothetical protein BDR25DRAFT_232351 [Lindgomyces ingoldianus]
MENPLPISRHPSLGVSRSLSTDIFVDIFDWFFTHPVFDRWQGKGVNWQLHCIGGPGSGKTTLAALVVHHLKGKVHSEGIPVISFFVQEDVYEHETAFLEDFLEILYRELGAYEACTQDDSSAFHSEYAFARYMDPSGGRARYRIHLIRKSVYSRVSTMMQSTPIYLVLDGIDRCSPTLRFLLEMELHDLQQSGLSILLTSRLAVYEQLEAKCDHQNHNGASDDEEVDLDAREALDLFLTCRCCENVMCFPCFEEGRICGECGTNDELHEQYDHVNVPIGIPDSQMKKFVAWDLEREHGDLGLKSSVHQKPPLSTLGVSILSDQTPNKALALVQEIVRNVYGNIGFAKARLDLVHEAESLERVEQRRDQLPANIIAIFDAGLKQIEAQPEEQRDLALKSIAGAGRTSNGVPVPELQRWLGESVSARIRSGEDILQAARGFLFSKLRDDPAKIYLCHPTFVYYVVERYHEGLHRANTQLTIDEAPKKGPSREIHFGLTTVSEEPPKITPFKISRTMTAMESPQEVRAPRLMFRNGTRAWN